MSDYYGDESAPGDVEWMSPLEAPPDEDELPPPPVDLDDRDSQPTYREERYSGTVHGVDYGHSKRPGSDPYEQSHGRLTPKQIDCLPPPDGCGAPAGQVCTFALERVESQMGHRKSTVVEGKRRMPCVSRIRRADQT